MRSLMFLVCGVAAISSLTLAQKRQQNNADDDRKAFERFLASPRFTTVREADHVDALPVEVTGGGLSATHRVVERPVALDPLAVRDLRRTMVSVKSYLGGAQACLFDPGVAFRFHKGRDTVQALVCFFCNELVFEVPGGKALSDKLSFNQSFRERLLTIAKKALPGSPQLPLHENGTPPHGPIERSAGRGHL